MFGFLFEYLALNLEVRDLQLVVKLDDGTEMPLKEVTSIDDNKENTIVLFMNSNLRPQDLNELEIFLSMKMGRNVVVLDSFFKDKILSV